jgi:hypothetical protein
VYWAVTNDGAIRRVPRIGTPANPTGQEGGDAVETVRADAGKPVALAFDRRRMLWFSSERGAVLASAKDGTGPATELAAGYSGAGTTCIAANERAVYWFRAADGGTVQGRARRPARAPGGAALTAGSAPAGSRCRS